MRKKQIKLWGSAGLACFALMVSLGVDLSTISAEAEDGGFFHLLAVNIKKLEYLLPVVTYRDGILAFFTLVFFWKMEEISLERISRWTYRILAGLTAFFLVFGYSFRYTNSWDLIFMDTFHQGIALLLMAGYYFLFVRIYRLMLWAVERWSKTGKEVAGHITTWLLEQHAFLGPMLVIGICWLPYIIAKFPGAAMPETLAEMRQFYWNSINNYYPPLHTVTLSLLMQLGNLIHSYTLGFFLNLVVQLLLLWSAFGYGFLLMKRWKTPYILRYLALSIICITQFFPMEATIVEKDVPYTACVIFVVLLLYEMIRTIEENDMPLIKIGGIIVVSMGVACNRNEGFYLILVAGVGTAIYAYRLLAHRNPEKCRRVLSALLLPVLLFILYQKVLLPVCGVEDNGPKEALSIPFQQTARYIRDYGYELSEEEEKVIAQVLDYEHLAELYDPITSDPVKYTFHAETSQDLMAYFGVWFRQLLKHPGNAIEATMNNAYGWFYQEGYAHNYMMDAQIEGHEVRWEIRQPGIFAGVRQVMERVAKLLSRVPVVNWFENAGFVSWMTILLGAFLLGARQKKYLLALSPLFMALLVCIAAPTFNYQMRYIMPVMFCVPFFLPMAVQSLLELEEEI